MRKRKIGGEEDNEGEAQELPQSSLSKPNLRLKRAKANRLELFKRPLATFLTNRSIAIMSSKYSEVTPFP